MSCMKELAGKAGFIQRDLLRGAFDHNISTGVTAFRSEVDDPVHSLNPIQVMVDDDNRVPNFGHPAEHIPQLLLHRTQVLFGTLFAADQCLLKISYEIVNQQSLDDADKLS
jgi:hypothetical protein